MTKDKQNIPKLRFSEFSGEWEEKKLGDLGRVSMCKRVMKHETLEVGDIPFYKIGTFGKMADSYISKELFNSYVEKYPFPKKGDILISASGTIGRKVIYDGLPAYFQDSNIVWISNDEKIIINPFLSYCYDNIKWNIENTTIARLYNDNLRNIETCAPKELKEQTKIANFLTAVDGRIEKLQEQKTLLEDYKKGVMQKIFNQQIRFTDKNNNPYPDWEEMRLGDFAEKKASNISANTLEDNNGKYKIYGASGLLKKIDFYTEDEPYISIVKDGAGVGRLLMCEAKSSILGTLDIIKPKENNNVVYLYYYLSTKNFNKFVIGSTIPHIYFKDYSKEKMQIPHIDEQQKIADFLSAIDKKNEKINAQIEESQKFKKGLLQQMFV